MDSLNGHECSQLLSGGFSHIYACMLSAPAAYTCRVLYGSLSRWLLCSCEYSNLLQKHGMLPTTQSVHEITGYSCILLSPNTRHNRQNHCNGDSLTHNHHRPLPHLNHAYKGINTQAAYIDSMEETRDFNWTQPHMLMWAARGPFRNGLTQPIPLSCHLHTNTL